MGVTPGRRVYPDSSSVAPDFLLHLKSGEYGRDVDGIWYARPPWEHASGNLRNHTVVEHADGTITVSPSILITCYPDGEPISWHGWLEHGVWREA